MRILHVFDHSLPLHSGYTFRSAAILREQRALGWETFHLTGPRQVKCEVAEEEVDGLHFYRTAPPTGLMSRLPAVNQLADMLALKRRLAEVIDTVRPDIVHAHSPQLNAIPALRAAHRRGIPVVYEVRAFWEDAAVDHGTTTEGSLRYRLSKHLDTYAFRRADAVTCICEGLRSDIVARGIAPEKVTVIPNGVDIEKFPLGNPPDETLKARFGLTGARVLGFIGSFYAYEGLDLLLAALPKILQQAPDVRVLLVGGGPQEGLLQRQAEALGIADKVVFTGRVPHAEVNRYYDLIDLLVYARHRMRLTELVTPLKPLEAMAQGHLFVASDVGGHRELICHGETGWLFPADDTAALARAVLQAFANRHRWEEMRARARRFVETERNWKASVARYHQVYEDARRRHCG
ncbi:TIGR04063 family PEP-CTERM/XrtA system glycosyltransferase [Thiobacter aerophilum]|uniref:TIGR04063 family PEP-CTERM/XrtA system glycosyltransferase n=1 Tax=Thiobacter aerophilum TaxID=3121275 RepID=A0ABV0EDH0_9BURK